MGDYITNIVVAVIFLYVGVVCFTKKNGGSARNEARYTAESLKKFSLINGVLMFVGAVVNILIAIDRMGIVKIFPDFGNPVLNYLVSYGPIIIILIIAVATMPILKKRDGYTDNRSKSSGNSDEDD